MKRDCPICSNDGKEILYKQSFSDNVLSPMKSYDVVECSLCGLVYADNIPPQAAFDVYYEKMSKYDQAMTMYKQIIDRKDTDAQFKTAAQKEIDRVKSILKK